MLMCVCVCGKGAVLAPHWNPRAMEIALVTKGEGDIQIVYPNGSAAATERVQEGTVFYVPQNFPMCQIASRGGPLEFLGFTTSSKPNNPQFLGGDYMNAVCFQFLSCTVHDMERGLWFEYWLLTHKNHVSTFQLLR